MFKIRILGIDYGDARVGFSVCDKSEILASGLHTEKVHGMTEAAEIAVRIALEEKAEMIVVGLPLNMDGTRGERAEKTEVFCSMLRDRIDIPIETIDERRTTVSAHNIMIENGVKRSKKKALVDTISAEIILQTFIDKRKRQREN